MAAKEYRVSTSRSKCEALVADGQLCKEVLRFLHSIDESGTALKAAIEDVDILPEPANNPITDASPVPDALPLPSPPDHSLPPISPSYLLPADTPSSVSSNSSHPGNRIVHLRTESGGRAPSLFQLSSPRFWTTPPSPRTVDVMPDQPTVPTPGDENGVTSFGGMLSSPQ